MSLDLPDWRVVYVIRKALPITGLDSPEANVSCFIPRNNTDNTVSKYLTNHR